MLKNYIKVAIRNLSRNKIYSVINIFGLTLGISVFTLLWLFINHEIGYNSYHSNVAILTVIVHLRPQMPTRSIHSDMSRQDTNSAIKKIDKTQSDVQKLF